MEGWMGEFNVMAKFSAKIFEVTAKMEWCFSLNEENSKIGANDSQLQRVTVEIYH